MKTSVLKDITKRFSLIKRDIRLLLTSPVEYLYSFSYSSKKKIRVEPYDSRVAALGNSLVDKLHRSLPGLTIYFVGSASLGIPGQRDIDLLASGAPKDFPKYIPVINTMLGEPDKVRKGFVEWHLNRQGCTIELILAHPQNPILSGPVEVYNLLKDNKNYLKEYLKIKLSSNGVSAREYKRKRLEFFNKIVKES